MTSDLTYPRSLDHPKCWETANFTVTELRTPAEAMYLSRKTGWCTRNAFSALAYLYQGPMWCIRKRGRNRPSYLYWKNCDLQRVPLGYDFRHRTNTFVDFHDFLIHHPELNQWFGETLTRTVPPEFNALEYEDELRECAQASWDNTPEDQVEASMIRLNLHIRLMVHERNPFPEEEMRIAQLRDMYVTRENYAVSQTRNAPHENPFGDPSEHRPRTVGQLAQFEQGQRYALQAERAELFRRYPQPVDHATEFRRLLQEQIEPEVHPSAPAPSEVRNVGIEASIDNMCEALMRAVDELNTDALRGASEGTVQMLQQMQCVLQQQATERHLDRQRAQIEAQSAMMCQVTQAPLPASLETQILERHRVRMPQVRYLDLHGNPLPREPPRPQRPNPILADHSYVLNQRNREYNFKHYDNMVSWSRVACFLSAGRE